MDGGDGYAVLVRSPDESAASLARIGAPAAINSFFLSSLTQCAVSVKIMLVVFIDDHHSHDVIEI